MSKLKQYRRIWLPMFSSLLLALVCGADLVNSGTAETATFGTILTTSELTATFGDGTCPCKKGYNCDQGFKSGSSNCARCTKTKTWTRCCNLGTNTSCTYSATNHCEGNVKSGPIDGSPATCDSCTASSETEGAACARKTVASGDTCP